MYTRTYTDDGGGILIPESYGGTALSPRSKPEESEGEESRNNPWQKEEVETLKEAESLENTQASAHPSKLHIPAFLSNIFKNSNFSLQNIGTEEILILATAAFLLFSKDGDKECAVMLLLLLFLG